MEATNYSILQSFQSLSISATNLDFGPEFTGSQTPEEIVASINHYLKQHSAHKIHKFRLLFSPYPAFLPDIENWVAFAVAKGVEELELDLSVGYHPWNEEVTNGAHSFTLPSCLYHCKSLTQLSLSYCDFVPPSDFTGFDRLQSLSLAFLAITDQTFEHLLSNCPLLRCLSLKRSNSLNSIKVSIPNLHRLSLDSFWVEGEINIFTPNLHRLSLDSCWVEDEINIYTPNLQSLIFNGELSYTTNVCAASLVDACICSLDFECTEPKHDYPMLLSQISHVKILTVCRASLLRVTFYEEAEPERYPIQLQNLKELQLLLLETSSTYLACIYGFFRLCPSPFIEKLFIQLRLMPESKDTMITDVEDPTDVVFNHLTAIKMINFTGTESDMKLVRFCLKRAPLLRNFVLVAPEKSEANEIIGVGQNGSASDAQVNDVIDIATLREQLTLLPKSSARADIVLCEYLEDDKTLNPTHTVYYSGNYNTVSRIM